MARILPRVSPLAEREVDRFRRAVGDCAEQVARLQRGLGNVPGHRDRLRAAASRLQSASRGLLASYQAAAERLNECGTPYIETTAEREVRGYCELSVDHVGPHSHIKSGLARWISAELHALADRTAKVSESFGWLAPRLDRFLTGRAALAQADRQQAQELIAQLLDIVDAAIRNARALTDDVLDLDPDLRIGSFVWTEDFADTADMIRDRLDQIAANEPARDPNQLDLF